MRISTETAAAVGLGGHNMPDMGAVLAGMPHPAEKEIRRGERPGALAAATEQTTATP